MKSCTKYANSDQCQSTMGKKGVVWLGRQEGASRIGEKMAEEGWIASERGFRGTDDSTRNALQANLKMGRDGSIK